MRARVPLWLVLPGLVVGGFVALSFTWGQTPTEPQQVPREPPPVPATLIRPVSQPAQVQPIGPARVQESVRPASAQGTPASVAPLMGTAEKPQPNLSKLTPLEKQIYWSTRRGSEWLCQMDGRDGRFVSGLLPSLGVAVEGDNFLHQAIAAMALARAARFTGEARYAASGTQSVLLLLADTTIDPNDANIRYTSLPSTVTSRIAAAGLLVAAIHELPAPQEDLLKQSEQLCNYIRRQQQADGSLCLTDDPAASRPVADADAINQFPGMALYGLMRSQQHRPAAWKTEMVHKALAYYGPWWRAHKSMQFVSWQTAAYTEAYLRTREKVFADFVNEMNDWLCGLQYDRLEPRHALWFGGFKSWSEGQAQETAPQISSAAYAESLAEASRVAREAGDLTRYRAYSEAVQRCLQFLVTLQYTDANTSHFAEWYLPTVRGAYHASHQDGNIRIDYAPHVILAQVQYLGQVIGGP